MTRRKTGYLPLVCMTALYLLFLFGNYVWLRIDRGYGWDDTVRHPMNGLACLDAGVIRDPYYPPLLSYLFAFGHRVSGRRDALGALSVSTPLFLFILMAGLSRLGIRFGSPWIGVIAAALTLSIPAVFHASRLCVMEFPDCALFVLFVALLAGSNLLRKRSFSLAAGVVAGVGMLTKQTFIFYVIFPLATAVIYALVKTERGSRSRVAANMAILGGAFLLVSGFWYAPRCIHLWRQYSVVGFHGEVASGHSPVVSVESFRYFLDVLYRQCFNGFFAGLFGLGLVAAWIRYKEHRGSIGICLAAVAGTYLSFTLIRDKHPKNIIPCIPFIALIITLGLASVRRRLARAGMLVVLAVTAYVQYWSVGFDMELPTWARRWSGLMSIKGGPHLWKLYAPVPNDDVLRVLLDIARDRKKGADITIRACGGRYSRTQVSSVLEYVVAMTRLPLAPATITGSSGAKEQGCPDYVVMYRDAFPDPRYELLSAYRNGLHENKEGNELYLYRRKAARDCSSE